MQFVADGEVGEGGGDLPGVLDGQGGVLQVLAWLEEERGDNNRDKITGITRNK